MNSNKSRDTTGQQIDAGHIRTGLGMYCEGSVAVNSTFVLAFMIKKVTFWHSGTERKKHGECLCFAPEACVGAIFCHGRLGGTWWDPCGALWPLAGVRLDFWRFYFNQITPKTK